MSELLDIAQAAQSAWLDSTSYGKPRQFGLGLEVEVKQKPKRRRPTRTNSAGQAAQAVLIPIEPALEDGARVEIKTEDPPEPPEHPERKLPRLQAALRAPILPCPALTNPRCYLATRECVDLPEDCFVVRSANQDRTEHTYTAYEPWAGRGEKFAGYRDATWGQVEGQRALRLIRQACPEAAAGRAVDNQIVAKFDATRMEPA